MVKRMVKRTVKRMVRWMIRRVVRSRRRVVVKRPAGRVDISTDRARGNPNYSRSAMHIAHLISTTIICISQISQPQSKEIGDLAICKDL